MMWIGEVGKVYSLLAIADNTVQQGVALAAESEGTIGFQCSGDSYSPVTYRSGVWVKALKEEVLEFSRSQRSQWNDDGSVMPREYHDLYQLMVDQAS